MDKPIIYWDPKFKEWLWRGISGWSQVDAVIGWCKWMDKHNRPA